MDYAQSLNERFRGTMAELIGMQISSAQPQRVAGELTIRPDLLQIYGFAHGGAIMTLLDTLAGMGASLNVPPQHGFLTLEFKINFLRSIRTGRIFGEATAVHLGRRTQVWQVTAHDERGRQLALATLTQMVVELQDT